MHRTLSDAERARLRRGPPRWRTFLRELKPRRLPVVRFLEEVGGHFQLLWQCLRWLVRRPFRWRQLLEALEYVGVGSLPIIVLVGSFTGMVTALQAVTSLRLLGGEGMSGAATGIALATELGPVLTGLMLAGRAGSGMATEIGTMRISEQIDALESMAISPVQFLVLPRVLAGLFMGPILLGVFFLTGMAGGYFVAVIGMGVDRGLFLDGFRYSVDPAHLVQGIIKSAVFGLIFALVGCYQGYHATGGGRGVGLATTRAVVVASVTVLVLDYFLTELLLPLLPTIE